MNLWEYIDSGAGEEYIQFATDAGATLDEEFELEYICNIGDVHQDILDFVKTHRHLGELLVVKSRPNHEYDTRLMSSIPKTVGYDERNTEYGNFGMIGNGNELIKEILGGPAAFEKMGIGYDRALCRLMVYKPGIVGPMHIDTMQAWRDRNKDINPHLVMTEESGYLTEEERVANSTTDIGLIKRRIVMVTPWSWGHFLQVKRTTLADWRSGDVWDSPPGIWHLAANCGIALRMTVTVTGVETWR